MQKKYLITASVACIISMFTACMNIKDFMHESTGPETKITIYGNVSDADSGEPLSNVAVSAIGAMGDGGVVTKTVTGLDGNYEMTASAIAGPFIIRGEKNKYMSTEQQLDFLSMIENNSIRKVDLQMHKEVIIYAGIVKDTNGTSIADAKIDISTTVGYSTIGIGSTFTNEKGEYTIEVPFMQAENSKNWTNWITASKEGFASKRQTVSHTTSDLGKTYMVNFELTTK